MNEPVRTYCVTGAASGLGAAVTARLAVAGHRVITLDLEHADVVADLSTERGRASAVHS
ncbi:MAG: NAD-dependent epimerase/dehydratase, partial [Actinomycetia bacterium]|nr:NAD-dependent epimerase/dehydratase [Actinomycetes bacterium]